MEPEPILERLDRIEAILLTLVATLPGSPAPKEWYTAGEAARLLGKAEFTVREWCRLGRIRAEKKRSGRGKYPCWVISRAELLRLEREGLLPPPLTAPAETAPSQPSGPDAAE